jgi:hypothetical protein
MTPQAILTNPVIPAVCLGLLGVVIYQQRKQNKALSQIHADTCKGLGHDRVKTGETVGATA